MIGYDSRSPIPNRAEREWRLRWPPLIAVALSADLFGFLGAHPEYSADSAAIVEF